MNLKRKLLIIIMRNITTPEFSKLTAESFAARLTKTDFDDKLKNFNKKISSIKTKYL